MDAEQCAIDFLRIPNRPSTFRIRLSKSDIRQLLGTAEGGLAKEIYRRGVWEWVAPNLAMLPSPLARSDEGGLFIGEWDDEKKLLFDQRGGGIWAIGFPNCQRILFANNYADMWAIICAYEKLVEEAVGLIPGAYRENTISIPVIESFARRFQEIFGSAIDAKDSFWRRQVSWHYSFSKSGWF